MRDFIAFLLCMTVCTGIHAQNNPKEQTEVSALLDEVVVTATGTEHKLKDVPVQTEIISKRELEALHAGSLEEILSALSPSLDFSTSGMGSNLQFGGLGNSYVLILIDGKKMNGDLGGQNNLSQINPSRIERIEIVKGAASALYGSDAMAGVINIITKKSIESLLVENTTRVGSYGDVRQFNTFQIKTGKWTLTTDLQVKHSDGWQNTTKENPNLFESPVTNSVNKTSNRFTDGEVEQTVRYTFDNRHELTGKGSWYMKQIDRPFGTPSYYTYDFQYRDVNTQIGGSHRLSDFRFKWDLNYDSHAYYYLYRRDTWETAFDEEGHSQGLLFVNGDKGLQSNQQRFLANAKGTYSIGTTHYLSAGAEYQYDWLDAPRRLERNLVSTFTTAVYLQDEWNPTDRLNITAGVRLTGNRNFGWKVSPKISAMYALNRFNLRVNYSEGFKTPTLKELHYLYISQMDQMTLTIGKKDLRPQSNRYVSAGVEYNSSKISFSVSGYLNRLDNMIALMLVPRSAAPDRWVVTFDPNRVKQYQNVNDAQTWGVDANVKWSPMKNLTFSAGYAYLDTQADFYNEKKERMEHVVIDGMAHHRATVGLLWTRAASNKKYRLSVGVNGRMQSKRFYIDNGDGKAYQLWRLNTKHTFPLHNHHTLEVNVGIDNLFNYYETTYHGLHYGTSTPGRTYYLSAKWSFAKRKKPLTH